MAVTTMGDIRRESLRRTSGRRRLWVGYRRLPSSLSFRDKRELGRERPSPWYDADYVFAFVFLCVCVCVDR